MGKSNRDVYEESFKKYEATNKNIVILDADVSGATKSSMFCKE